jgi:ABC-type multidrug transport system fused ATPase/permease subunit
LDKTPVARVIARCTEDIQAVDDTVANEINRVIQITIMMLIRLGAVMIFTPVFILPCVALIRSIASANVTFRGVLIAVLGGFVGQLYMKAQLSVKREMSNAKAPVIGIFNGAVSGLVSIRAYGSQDMFRKESRIRLDRYVRSARAFHNLNRWVRPCGACWLVHIG